MLIYYGYTGRAASFLSSKCVKPGDRVIIRLKDGSSLSGLLLPRPQLYSSDSIIVVKLINGYNIGISLQKIQDIEISRSITHVSAKEGKVGEYRITSVLPRVTLISTGGTIASKVDYETGAVTPALKPEEILEWIPELGEISFISSKEIMSIFSEDMTPQLWERIATEVYEEVRNNVDGVVIAHGTDTMSYTASALAFSIQNKPVPIVFVGAQRSSDRPSTDAVYNLLAGFITASKAPFAESVVVMHGDLSDKFNTVHRGVKTRKMHTSRRDAFQSINDKPLALVDVVNKELRLIGNIVEYRGRKDPILKPKFDDKVALVKVYPGLQDEIIETLVDKGYHGIVIEGTGLGHAPNKLIDSIKRAVENGIPVVMTSQCLFGHVDMYVYSTGRRLLEAGVIPGYDMLPETAYVKLSWILGSLTRDIEEVREIFTTNLVGEINPRHTPDLYPRWIYEH
ncbi:MAG: Glu-tRNA(Gln) amidotransferase subunit GatD [Desulfurococcaceae archaeon]